jgi:hypothetical protein
MKILKRFLLFSFILNLVSFNLYSCDICGCAAGTNYLGVLPQFDRNLAGLRFQYSRAIHPIGNYNTNDRSSQVLEDRFYSTEVWLRYYLSEKWQLFVNVPYGVNQRLETNRITTIQGIGDIRMNLNYTLVDYGDSITRDWKNLLLVGAGVGLPTGKYQQRDDAQLMLPALFQIGTGAFSYQVNLNHTIRYRTWGLNTWAMYRFRGENELSYDFGNHASFTSTLFYWGEYEKGYYMPNLGIGYDHFGQDYQYDVIKSETGGDLWNLNVGFDLYFGKFLLNAFAQFPIVQNIPGAQPANSGSAGAGISYFF